MQRPLPSARPARDLSGRRAVWRWIALAGLVVEGGMLSLFRNVFGPHISPVVLFAASLLPGLSLIVLSVGDGAANRTVRRGATSRLLMSVAVTSVGLLFTATLAHRAFQRYPIDPKFSDIIPMIAIMVRRFLTGEYPYSLIETFGYRLVPNYFPATWVPFTVAEVLAIDYRWISFAVLAAAVFAYQIHLFRSAAPGLMRSILALLPFTFWCAILVFAPQIFASSVEPLFTGYYLMLSLALFGSPAVQALTLMLCLASRYSLLLWLPLYLGILWLRDARQAARLGAMVIVLMLIVLGPLLMYDPGLLERAYRTYDLTAPFEWMRTGSAPDAKPYHLFSGIGLAVYFYDFAGGEIADKIRMLKYVHIVALLLCCSALGVVYWRVRDRVDASSFALGSLSIYLGVFYAFIQVPYHYLMIVPLFVACAVVCRCMTLPAAVGVGEVAADPIDRAHCTRMSPLAS